ncbi:PHP domain-containing protein [Puteibacter caeruleilacunae]|nr:PHP domain-containing protein [Puteibacter caeruleilacunae]
MKEFRADLHIHTVLSPCGDLEMSPVNIIEQAKECKLDIIGIADHNSTKQCNVIHTLGKQHGITVLFGAEVTTKEEVHCLTFFENIEYANLFQQFLDDHLPFVKNNPELFGYQVVVDKDELIVEQEERLLITALNVSIEKIEQKVHELNGIFIPAHIDKKVNGLLGQLGVIPKGLKADAYEITGRTNPEQLYERYFNQDKPIFIQNSDAHIPELIGSKFNRLLLKEPSFTEIKLALANKDGRKVLG